MSEKLSILSQAVHTSLHDADLLIHWLFPFILFCTPPFPPIEDKTSRACHRVPFPVPQPSFPSAPKADLPPQSMCIHNFRDTVLSWSLYVSASDLWSHPHSINRVLSDAKNWTCLKRGSQFSTNDYYSADALRNLLKSVVTKKTLSG